jgi:hypothetical protein
MLLTMNIDEQKLKDIDLYWSKNGFANRTEFIKFACYSVMDSHNDDSYLLIQEQYYNWLMKTLKEKFANDIVHKLNIESIKEDLFKMVIKNLSKEIIVE